MKPKIPASPATPSALKFCRYIFLFTKKVGFNKPWIGYFVANDYNEIIGGGGYKGKPKGGKVEIAYGTFKNTRGRELVRQFAGSLFN